MATSHAKDAPSISLGPSGRELNFIRKSAGGLPIRIFAQPVAPSTNVGLPALICSDLSRSVPQCGQLDR